jgi:hypothetical protein
MMNRMLHAHRIEVQQCALQQILFVNRARCAPLLFSWLGAVAVVDQIRAVSKERLSRKIEIISTHQLKAVEEGPRAILEL